LHETVGTQTNANHVHAKPGKACHNVPKIAIIISATGIALARKNRVAAKQSQAVASVTPARARRARVIDQSAGQSI
jgi:hypothetical protein